MKNKILVSIADFPLFRSLEYNFSEIAKTKADGIELVHGIKSHWPFKKIINLTKKYNLPVLSVHQPLWSGYGVPDFSFVKFAKNLDVKKIVIHPLSSESLNSIKMQKYLRNLAKIQKENGLEMLLENLPVREQAPLVDKFFPGHKDALDPLLILKAAKQYGFKMTLDTAHLEDKDLYKREWLKDVLENTGNIHLSNFSYDKPHYPLDIGVMNYKGFLGKLKEYNYKEPITLEIYYPKMTPLRNYDYSGVKKSIEIIKKA
jgi:sugar phosphate isomerase/epimerase